MTPGSGKDGAACPAFRITCEDLDPTVRQLVYSPTELGFRILSGQAPASVTATATMVNVHGCPGAPGTDPSQTRTEVVPATVVGDTIRLDFSVFRTDDPCGPATMTLKNACGDITTVTVGVYFMYGQYERRLDYTCPDGG